MNPIKKIGVERSVISPLIACTLNIVLLFLIYTVLRVEYLLENYSYFQPAVQ